MPPAKAVIYYGDEVDRLERRIRSLRRAKRESCSLKPAEWIDGQSHHHHYGSCL